MSEVLTTFVPPNRIYNINVYPIELFVKADSPGTNKNCQTGERLIWNATCTDCDRSFHDRYVPMLHRLPLDIAPKIIHGTYG